MEDWLEIHEYKIKIASLIVASLVLGSAISKWLKQKWMGDVNMRRYAHLSVLQSSMVAPVTELKVEVPIAQDVKVDLMHKQERIKTLIEGHLEAGVHPFILDLVGFPEGDYELVMRTDDQQNFKKIKWRP
jgi:hypothetical protein